MTVTRIFPTQYDRNCLPQVHVLENVKDSSEFQSCAKNKHLNLSGFVKDVYND